MYDLLGRAYRVVGELEKAERAHLLALPECYIGLLETTKMPEFISKGSGGATLPTQESGA